MRAALAIIIVVAFFAMAGYEFFVGGDGKIAAATAFLGVANYLLLVR